jgi:DNA replication protein DnaD
MSTLKHARRRGEERDESSKQVHDHPFERPDVTSIKEIYDDEVKKRERMKISKL